MDKLCNVPHRKHSIVTVERHQASQLFQTVEFPLSPVSISRKPLQIAFASARLDPATAPFASRASYPR
jgi:hypothetical protein